MKHKRFLAILLAVVMLFSIIPPGVFAALPPAEESIPVPVAPTESPPEIGEELPVKESEPETEIPPEEPPTEVTEAPTEVPTEAPVPTEVEPIPPEDTAPSEPEFTEATEVTEPTELTEPEESSEPEAPTEEAAPTEPISTEAVVESTTDPIEEVTLPQEAVPSETIPTEPNPLLMEDGNLFELPEDITELNEAKYNYMVANGISELADGTPLSEVREATPQRTYIGTKSKKDLTYSYSGKTVTHAKNSLYYWAIHRIDGKVAYCIEPGTDFAKGKHYSSNAENGEYWNSLPWGIKRGIRLTLLYGAPNGYAGGKTKTGYAEEMATGVIIWEFLCGYRNTVPPYNCTNDVFYQWLSNFTAIGYDNENGEYQSMGDYREYLKQVYNDISAKLAKHNTVLSFSNLRQEAAPTYAMERQADGTYYLELTDTNNILSEYTFTNTSNLTFVKSGNKLKITAKEPFSSYTVETSKIVPNPDKMGLLCWYSDKTEANSKQVILQLVSATEDPLPAYFKLTAPSANSLALSKVSAEGGSVEGFCFKIYSSESHKTFYGKTDADGKAYITDSDYNQLGDQKEYTFSSHGLVDGKYSFLEALSQHGENQYWPESWQIIVCDASGQEIQNMTFTEFTNQDGDCKLTDVEIKGLGNGGSIKMIITNRLLKANFDIQKYILNSITQTRTKEAGAEFTYYDASYSSYEEAPEQSRGIMTTDENGKATSKDLPLGTYRVEQTKTAPGTKAVEPFEVELTEAGATYSFNLDNPLWTASVELYKITEDTQQPLKGAIFGLYDKDDNALEEKTTGANGKINFDTLLVYGESYYIQEISAPNGFERDDTKYPVFCASPDQVIKLTCENVRKARFTIQKYILNPVSQERTKEANAEFTYYDISYGSYENAPEDSRGVMTTNKNGKAISKYLSVGTYLVEQTKTAPGTDAVEPFEVELTEAGADLTFELDNPLWTASVELYKVEKGTQKPLKDAAFGLFNSENDLLETKVTGEDGKINFDTLLVYGETYFIQEAEAPLGYEWDPTMYPVTCTERNQKVEITCENVPYAYFSIQKYILDPTTQDRTEEANAEFTYYDVSYGSYENAPEESRGVMTTDEDGKATSKELPLATYLVEQTKTAPGTDAIEPIEFTLTEAGATFFLELDNPLWTAEVDIFKVDRDTEEPLKDAVFGLYDAEDNLLEQVTTKEDGTAVFETLLVYGNSYYVQEIEAPPGYEKDTGKYPVSCIQREQKVSIFVTNEGIPGVIEVTKTTTDGSSVEGYLATVTQSKENGTDSNSVFLRSQEDGTFALSSQESPYDFLLDDEGNPVTSFTGFTDGSSYTFSEEIQLLAGTDKAAFIPTAFTFTLTKVDGTPGSITYKDTVYEGTLTLTGEDILTDEEIGNYYVTGLAFDGLDYGGKLDVSIQNEIVAGKIEILKVDPASKPLAGAIFLLEWSEDGSNWNPVTLNETDAIVMGGCRSEGLVDGCLTTGEDGYAIFVGLHTGCQYRLSEVYAPNGYELLADYAYVGTLPENNEYILYLTVVNRPAYNLPGTGAPGETHLFPVFGISLAATAAFVLFLLLADSKKKTVILNYRSKR